MTVDSRSTDLAPAHASYGSFETVDGHLVIYDRDNPDAWIMSTLARSLEEPDPSTSTVGRS